MFIERFKINSLFGYKDVDIRFENPILILIGENGYGKTTILNALNYTLQGRYKELLEIKFESIEIGIAGKTFNFTYEQLSDYNNDLQSDGGNQSIIPYLKKNLTSSEFETLCNLVKKNVSNFSSISNPIIKNIPRMMVYHEIGNYNERLKRFGVFESLKDYISSFNYNILFKPTYRRVEADLSESFNMDRSRSGRIVLGTDDDQSRNYAATIIRFGMKDVQRKIKDVTDTIKSSSLQGFAKVSSDMIRHLLDNNNSECNLELDIESLRIILERTGDNLTKEEKDKIIAQIEDKKSEPNPYLQYFLEQLYSVYKQQEHIDSAIKKFRDVCNRYLKEKQFVYDESRVDLKVYRVKEGQINSLKDEDIVDLNYLSSGEKQIVSLFAQIYLDVDKRFVMLLDEPELSLSIFWQENLLDDIYNSGRCDFLLAVTHSPFIFRKSMKQFVIGLQEFSNN